MKRLKPQVKLDELAIIDFELGVFTYKVSENDGVHHKPLNADERVILGYLCKKHDHVVNLTELFEVIKGRPCRKSDNKRDITVKMSTLLDKVRVEQKGETRRYITKPQSGEFKLCLNESPFEDNTEPSETIASMDDELLRNSIAFFKQAIEITDIISVDLVFHAGRDWCTTDEYVELLDILEERKISCKVMLNDTSEAVQTVIDGMGHPEIEYSDRILVLRNWAKWKRDHTVFEVKVTSKPLLHCWIHFHCQNPSSSIMRVQYYTYGNKYHHKNYTEIFNSMSPFYKLYSDEFSFLWEKYSVDVDAYLNANQ